MIVADTGGLLALIDKTSNHHAAIRKFFESSTDPWIVPWAVLPELDYIVRKKIGMPSAIKFLNDVKSGVFVVDFDFESDMSRILDLLAHKPRIGLADAVVMTQAERYGATTVITTDARDFKPWRLTQSRHIKLVPHDK